MTDSKTQETRIEHIFGEDNLNVSDESLVMYRSYDRRSVIIFMVYGGDCARRRECILARSTPDRFLCLPPMSRSGNPFGHGLGSRTGGRYQHG